MILWINNPVHVRSQERTFIIKSQSPDIDSKQSDKGRKY